MDERRGTSWRTRFAFVCAYALTAGVIAVVLKVFGVDVVVVTSFGQVYLSWSDKCIGGASAGRRKFSSQRPIYPPIYRELQPSAQVV